MGVLSLRRQILMAQPHKETVVGDGTATFDTDFKAPMRVEIPFEPVQDLHGYDHPWPGGGGKNLFDKTDASKRIAKSYLVAGEGALCRNVSTIKDTRIVWINCEANTTYTVSCDVTTTLRLASFESFPTADRTEPSAFNAPSPTTTIPAGTGLSLTTGPNDSYLFVQVFADGDMGTITFESATNKLMVEKGSTASAYAHYENICPISGWTGCNIYNEKNNSAFPHLVNWGQKLTDTLGSWSGSTYVGKRIEDGWMVIRTSTSSNRSYFISQRTTIVKDHIYLFKAIIENLVSDRTYYIGTSQTKTYSLPKNVETTVGWCFSSTVDYTTWTIREDAFHASVGDIFRVKNIMLFDLTEIFGEETASYVYGLEQEEAGAGVAWFNSIFPNEYYEYNDVEQMTVSEVNGDPYEAVPITFANPSTGDPITAYGGTVTLNEDGSADLVVTQSMSVPTFNEGWTKSGTMNWWRNYTSKKRGTHTAFCSHFTVTTYSSSDRIQLNNTGFTAINDLIAYQSAQILAGTPVQILRVLDTPITYHFANIGQLKSFLGENNVWSDLNGDPTVTFWKHG